MPVDWNKWTLILNLFGNQLDMSMQRTLCSIQKMLPETLLDSQDILSAENTIYSILVWRRKLLISSSIGVNLQNKCCLEISIPYSFRLIPCLWTVVYEVWYIYYLENNWDQYTTDAVEYLSYNCNGYYQIFHKIAVVETTYISGIFKRSKFYKFFQRPKSIKRKSD